MVKYIGVCSIVLNILFLSWLSETFCWAASSEGNQVQCGDQKCPFGIQNACAGMDLDLIMNHPLLLLILPCLKNENVTIVEINCNRTADGANMTSDVPLTSPTTIATLPRKTGETYSINPHISTEVVNVTTQTTVQSTSNHGETNRLWFSTPVKTSTVEQSPNKISSSITTTQIKKETLQTDKASTPKFIEKYTDRSIKTNTKHVQTLLTSIISKITGITEYPTTEYSEISTHFPTSLSKSTDITDKTPNYSYVSTPLSPKTPRFTAKSTSKHSYVSTPIHTVTNKSTDITDSTEHLTKEYSEMSTHLPTTLSKSTDITYKTPNYSDVSTPLSPKSPRFTAKSTSKHSYISTPTHTVTNKFTDITNSTTASPASPPVIIVENCAEKYKELQLRVFELEEEDRKRKNEEEKEKKRKKEEEERKRKKEEEEKKRKKEEEEKREKEEEEEEEERGAFDDN